LSATRASNGFVGERVIWWKSKDSPAEMRGRPNRLEEEAMTETGSERPLQFDRAESESQAEGPAVCSDCGEPIEGVYYQLAEALVCERCRERKLAEREAGSGLRRWTRAAMFGTVAAIGGAVLWYAVAKLTGYEFALIAIVIGLMVGGAVRVGSRRRGGWVYQGLAMFLTYASIVSTYAPDVVQGLVAAMEEGDAGDDETSIESVPAVAVEAGDEGAAASEAEVVAATETAGGAGAVVVQASLAEPPPGGGALLPALAGVGVGLAFFVFILFAAPFLAGFENFMGWIILAIGLYEAWKLNRRTAFVFEGPFRMSGGRPEPRAEIAPPPITPS
jgi:hypothetical protein